MTVPYGPQPSLAFVTTFCGRVPAVRRPSGVAGPSNALRHALQKKTHRYLDDI